MATLTETDEGKRVVGPTGIEIGIINEVRDGVAYIHPDAALTDQINSMFGLDDADDSRYRVENEAIRTISEGEIRLHDEADLARE